MMVIVLVDKDVVDKGVRLMLMFQKGGKMFRSVLQEGKKKRKNNSSVESAFPSLPPGVDLKFDVGATHVGLHLMDLVQ